MKNGHPFPNFSVITLAQKYLSSSSLVLDVGCNKGQIGKIIKDRTGCRVVGIDNSQKVLKRAKEVLDKVILADVESKNLILRNRQFDLIIFSNILEHLKNPIAVLKNFKRYLKPEGFFLIAVPNTAFWSIRLNLLLGRFDYQEVGILSWDHLRFFTLKTLKKMLQEAGLEIEVLITNYLGWREKIARLWPTLLASQFITLCHPRSGHLLFSGKNKKFGSKP